MTVSLENIKDFNIEEASISLWIFKKSQSAAKFRARYVQTTDELNQTLKSLVTSELSKLTESIPYSHLAQNNEVSCLQLSSLETNFEKLEVLLQQQELENRLEERSELTGTAGYAVKLTHDESTLFAIKRTTSSWKATFPKKFVNIIFRNGELDAAEDNSFSLEKNFDFFASAQNIFIRNKNAFESIMTYKSGFTEAFVALKDDANFSGTFTNMDALNNYIGNNAMHLRRMATVEQKGIFKHPNFLSTLRSVSQLRGYGINFEDGSNKIIPCENTAATIIQILLDHRLISEITSLIYDVPDATQI